MQNLLSLCLRIIFLLTSFYCKLSRHFRVWCFLVASNADFFQCSNAIVYFELRTKISNKLWANMKKIAVNAVSWCEKNIFVLSFPLSLGLVVGKIAVNWCEICLRRNCLHVWLSIFKICWWKSLVCLHANHIICWGISIFSMKRACKLVKAFRPQDHWIDTHN